MKEGSLYEQSSTRTLEREMKGEKERERDIKREKERERMEYAAF